MRNVETDNRLAVVVVLSYMKKFESWSTGGRTPLVPMTRHVASKIREVTTELLELRRKVQDLSLKSSRQRKAYRQLQSTYNEMLRLRQSKPAIIYKGGEVVGFPGENLRFHKGAILRDGKSLTILPENGECLSGIESGVDPFPVIVEHANATHVQTRGDTHD